MLPAAYLDNEAVGAIACRLEAQGGRARLYIMTLGVLAPYRSRGIGSALLRRAMAAVADDDMVVDAYLHVHVENEEAVVFYKRAGFHVGELVENYYKKLKPPHAVLLVHTFNRDGRPAARPSS